MSSSSGFFFAPGSVKPASKNLLFKWASWLVIVAVTVLLLHESWRKWPDAHIDFGNQLYVPWRLSQGDVLYRDVGHYYGPFSQYLNSVIFRLFGPGLMVLVTVNLGIFAAIVALIKNIFGKAWGVKAATIATVSFVVIFGFSQFVMVGNYNYATPYAHESTHGLLISLVLVSILISWIENPTILRSLIAGFILGLTAVLKPEFMLAGGCITLAAFFLNRRFYPSAKSGAIAMMAIGVSIPSLLFWAWFSVFLPLPDALLAATRAWSVLFTSPEISNNTMQNQFLGLDRPWLNIQLQVIAAASALLILLGLGFLTRALSSLQRSILRGACILFACIVIAWISYGYIAWLQFGRCLLGMNGLYVFFKLIELYRRPAGSRPDLPEFARFLLALLALLLLARMGLNGRFFHFGFYQAALATLVIIAVAFDELPGRWHRHIGSRWISLCLTTALLVPELGVLSLQSHSLLKLKTETVGSGTDRFYSFNIYKSPSGRLVSMASEFLAAQPKNQSVLTLPEGAMINYLSRKKSPISPLLFFSFGTSELGEKHWVHELEVNPPEWVVLISRDLRSYGILRYGDYPGQGKEILAWVGRHYKKIHAAGGDPLDPDQQGIIIYQRQ